MYSLHLKTSPSITNVKRASLLKLSLNIVALLFLVILSNFSIAQVSADNPATNTGNLSDKISSFTASLKKDAALLKWQIAAEQNNQEFVVQHNCNGSAWNNIGVVKAAVVNGSIQYYSFLHTSPAKGVNNYRLSQTDADGHTNYSNPVSLVNIGEAKQLTVIPPR